jgi:hypothetical protein
MRRKRGRMRRAIVSCDAIEEWKAIRDGGEVEVEDVYSDLISY